MKTDSEPQVFESGGASHWKRPPVQYGGSAAAHGLLCVLAIVLAPVALLVAGLTRLVLPLLALTDRLRGRR